MRELSALEIKQLAYETLVYFSDFCESHELRYFLAYGTLLGAVRHGGFIPWDDDIDVYMPREDYDKLLFACKEELCGSLYELNANELNPFYFLTFGKLSRKDTIVLPSAPFKNYVRRVALDIFPLDTFFASSDEETARAEYVRFWEEETRITRKYHPGRGFGWKKFVKPIVYKLACLRYGDYEPRMRSWTRMLVDHHPHEGDTLYLANVNARRLYKQEWFQKSVKLKFETGEFYAPVDYDAVLHLVYGDYMTPPPPDERKPPHLGKVYYLDG